MFLIKLQPQLLESPCLRRIEFVGPAHFVAELKEKSGNSAHAATGDADQMNAMTFARQKFRKIDILGHHRVNFSMVVATRSAASRGARLADFSDICRTCSGGSTI